jgi:hypothetical protein
MTGVAHRLHWQTSVREWRISESPCAASSGRHAKPLKSGKVGLTYRTRVNERKEN